MEKKENKKSGSSGERSSGGEKQHHFQLLDTATERFNRQLEEIEKRAIEQQEEYSEELMEATARAISEVKQACETFEKAVANERAIIKDAQHHFRKKTQKIFSTTYFNRARLWPQGYQGDYVMLDYLYKNDPSSDSAIGFYLNRYLLATTLAVAVRERKETLRGLLREELQSGKTIKVLDIACGSCQEVFELAPDILKSGAKFTFVDYDNDALQFSSVRLSQVGLVPPHVDFRSYNALKLVNAERNCKDFGVQDVIYSVGLFDYLKDDVLVRLIPSLYDLLSSGGKLIVSFKDSVCYSTFIYHWLIAWDGFLQRTEEDVWKLLEKTGVPISAVTTKRKQSDVITFFIAAK